MSRNIDAVIGESSAVSRPRVRWKNGPFGGKPSAVATALHSSSMPSRKSLPPAAARMLPTDVRIRLVDAASDARNTHFSHMSWMTCSLTAEFGVEHVEMLHAVEQRDDRGLVSHRGRERLDRIVQVERLAAQQHDVELVL